ncbi:hypothetical protein J6590_051434 [Homalodisca vitripennis]|nr:hypothetical protein J6590_051434 [Homalodisca vitripennis]
MQEDSRRQRRLETGFPTGYNLSNIRTSRNQERERLDTSKSQKTRDSARSDPPKDQQYLLIDKSKVWIPVLRPDIEVVYDFSESDIISCYRTGKHKGS